MFVVTNRNINDEAEGLAIMGEKPNTEGPNELRLIEATKEGSAWNIRIIPDELDDQLKQAVGIPSTEKAYGSAYAARKVLKRVQDNKQNILIFVHGFNNDFESVLNRAAGFAEKYDLEVIPFSWPANGGGVKGVVDYKSDKRDARASVGALDRTFGKIYDYLNVFNQERMKTITERAMGKHPNNAELRDQLIARAVDEECPFTVNLALHSMGNYLFKHVLTSSIYRGTTLLFDNVVMVAADTNNEDHAGWVDRIQCRKRVYITINEDDAALMASRIKAGEEQMARLGHYPHNLTSKIAVYVNFTGAPYVGRSHAYFEGPPIRNDGVKNFFQSAFNGERAEEALRFDPASRTYHPR